MNAKHDFGASCPRQMITDKRCLRIMVFDLDGTLRDGLEFRAKVFDLAGKIAVRRMNLPAAYALPFPSDEMRKYAGISIPDITRNHWHQASIQQDDFIQTYQETWKAIDTVVSQPDTPFPFMTADDRRAIAAFPAAPWFKELEPLPRFIARQGCFQAILSGTPTSTGLRREVAAYTEQAPYFDMIHSGNDIGAGKPSATPFLNIISTAIYHALGGQKPIQTIDEWASVRGDFAQASAHIVNTTLIAERNADTLRTNLNVAETMGMKLQILMVGDGDLKSDMGTAKNAAAVLRRDHPNLHATVRTLAVGYGFSSQEKLLAADPDAYAATPLDAFKICRDFAMYGERVFTTTTPSVSRPK